MTIRNPNLFIFALVASIVFSVQPAWAKKEPLKVRKAKCPKVIAVPYREEYQVLKSSNYYCFPSKKDADNFAKLRTLKASQRKKKVKYSVKPYGICAGGPFEIQTELYAGGQGDGVTPPFQVLSRSMLVTYAYDGPGSFKVDLINYATGKSADVLVSGGGPIEGQTYINHPGRYYLKIKAAVKMVDDFAEGYWDVEVEQPY